MLCCILTTHAKWLVYFIVFLSETIFISINYVFIHSALWLCKKLECVKLNIEYFHIYTVYPFFCPLLYGHLQTGLIMVWWCLSVRSSGSPSIRLSVRPSVRPSGSPSASFPHFSLTCFDILSWNFAYDFVLLYFRSSSSVVYLRQVWW